jgi:hypothetical protein
MVKRAPFKIPDSALMASSEMFTTGKKLGHVERMNGRNRVQQAKSIIKINLKYMI